MTSDTAPHHVFRVVDPRSAPALRSMEAYFRELDERFAGGFDPGDTLISDAPAMRPPTGSFLIAEAETAAIGCGGIVRIDDETAELKRMWVDPNWRGVGVGRRLLARLEGEAVTLGYRRVVLDTNRVLTEAVAMYERSGYDAIGRYNDNPYAHHWFAKTLVD